MQSSIRDVYDVHDIVEEWLTGHELIVKVSSNETMLKVGPIENSVRRIAVGPSGIARSLGIHKQGNLYLPFITEGFIIKIVTNWYSKN